MFIDEIDKVARRQETIGADVSREGVQRDLLPLVEGCTVSTKYGTIKTDHVLFIASGAFHMSKPSDLIPELQGRLPIRVELDSLKVGRLRAHPHRARRLADHAVQGADEHRGRGREVRRRTACGASPRSPSSVNEQTENIGARRLHTVMERLLESVSFDAAEQAAAAAGRRSTPKYVDEHLGALAKDEDLSRYIL